MRSKASFVLLLFASLNPGRGQEPAVELYVDAEHGSDGANASGLLESPFKSLTHALKVAEARNSFAVTVYIQAGKELRALGAGGLEHFPLRLATGWKRLFLRGWRGTARLESTPWTSAFLELDAAFGGELALEFEGLSFLKGLNGLSFLSRGALEKLSVIVHGCTFSGQGSRGIELYVDDEASASLFICGSVFEGSSGGVLAETGKHAHLNLVVEGSQFRSLSGYGPGALLGSGVDVHLDPFGDVAARIQRNIFQGMASAVQLTASEEDDELKPSGGKLEARVASNLIGGRPSLKAPEDPSLKNGIYLSLWPHHEIDLQITNNTFAGIQGFVIYRDNSSALGDASFVPWLFANNICHGIGAESEFDVERPGEEFPGPGITVINNLLEKSRLSQEGAGQNLRGDPGFVDEANFDFHLRAGSPAIDRGDSRYLDASAVDLDGNCRAAAVECSLSAPSYPVDLGAYEFPGLCSTEPVAFLRGDCNQSAGFPEIGDAIYTFGFLFLGEAAPLCPDACDSNDDGKLDITDGIYTLTYLFLGGKAPPPPFEGWGQDPTRDCLPNCSGPESAVKRAFPCPPRP